MKVILAKIKFKNTLTNQVISSERVFEKNCEAKKWLSAFQRNHTEIISQSQNLINW